MYFNNYFKMSKDQVSTISSLLNKESPVFICDLDYCVYNSKKMRIYEYETAKNRFIKLTKLTGDYFDKINESPCLFNELFYKYCGIDNFKYCETYDIPPFHEYIKPDYELNNLFRNLKCTKVAFTNGCSKRVQNLLEYLEMKDIFDHIICIDEISNDFVCKPKPSSYEYVQKLLGIKNSANIIFCDDNIHNITKAKELGWKVHHIIHETDDGVEKLKEVLIKYQNTKTLFI